MKNSKGLLIIAALAFFCFLSCTEKELILPERESTGETLESLSLRPSLRPDSVKAYPAFYNTVEIVFPEKQPERAASASISYTKDDGTVIDIKVTDFNEIVRVSDLSIKPHAFTIQYYTAEGKASKSVVKSVTPYLPVPEYAAGTLSGRGFLGLVHLKWNNITTKEVEVEVSYVDNGVEKKETKLSSILQDSITIEGLENKMYDFTVLVKDLTTSYSSQAKILQVNPGVSSEIAALASLTIQGGYGRATTAWTNPNGENLEFTFTLGNQDLQKVSTLTTDSYLLKNLPEGQNTISVKVKNLKTGKISGTRVFSTSVLKGVKEQILSELSVKSLAGGYVVVGYNNPSNVPSLLDISFLNQSNVLDTRSISIAGGIGTKYVLLSKVGTGATINTKVTDDIGYVTSTSIYSTGPTATQFAQTERNTWIASASSFRGGPTALDQAPNKTLDGIYSVASTGTVTSTHWVTEWGQSRLDSTGTASNKFPHFLSFDFAKNKVITAVQTYNVGGSQSEEGALDFSIQVSDDGKNWITIKDTKRTVFTRGGNEIFQLDTPVVTRFLRLYYKTSSGTNGTGAATGTVRVAEFFAYGYIL